MRRNAHAKKAAYSKKYRTSDPRCFPRAQVWTFTPLSVYVLRPSKGQRAKTSVAPLTKPSDNLGSRAEPGVQRLQRADKPDIEVAPETFWSVAPVVPDHSQDTSEALDVRNERGAAFFRF